VADEHGNDHSKCHMQGVRFADSGIKIR
jgi:hypothetical protein